jgi:hypothetical protein
VGVVPVAPPWPCPSSNLGSIVIRVTIRKSQTCNVCVERERRRGMLLLYIRVRACACACAEMRARVGWVGAYACVSRAHPLTCLMLQARAACSLSG